MINSIIKRAKERFEKEFVCQIPEHRIMSDHWLAHDKRGMLQREFQDFLETEIRAAVRESLEEVNIEMLKRSWVVPNTDFADGILAYQKHATNKINEILNKKE